MAGEVTFVTRSILHGHPMINDDPRVLVAMVDDEDGAVIFPGEWRESAIAWVSGAQTRNTFN